RRHPRLENRLLKAPCRDADRTLASNRDADRTLASNALPGGRHGTRGSRGQSAGGRALRHESVPWPKALAGVRCGSARPTGGPALLCAARLLTRQPSCHVACALAGVRHVAAAPTVGRASLRCAPFRNSKPSCHVAFALAGVRHG